jgi:hypothetical protein
MLTEAQITWAEQHDWFGGRVGDTIEVVDRWVDATGTSGEDRIIWSKSFRELRLWAGY